VPGRRLERVVTPNPGLARRVMDLYMLMVTTGMVHADPHPGNIGFLPSGRLVMYDFGAVLRIEPDVGGALTRVLRAGVTSDVDGVVAALEDLGVLRLRPGQKPVVRRLVRRLMASGAGVHEELQRSPEFTASGGRRRVVAFEQTFIYLARTLTLVEGACRYLDPDFEYDYARWVTAPAPMDVAADVARDLASLPSTLRSMQSDLEDFQARVAGDMDEAYEAAGRAGRVAATALVVLLLLLQR
jgi:predicted unusual protein kinase regulating ubiquinone biosynthesis (AarF/ABC1/UbiB family)